VYILLECTFHIKQGHAPRCYIITECPNGLANIRRHVELRRSSTGFKTSINRNSQTMYKS